MYIFCFNDRKKTNTLDTLFLFAFWHKNKLTSRSKKSKSCANWRIFRRIFSPGDFDSFSNENKNIPKKYVKFNFCQFQTKCGFPRTIWIFVPTSNVLFAGIEHMQNHHEVKRGKWKAYLELEEGKCGCSRKKIMQTWHSLWTGKNVYFLFLCVSKSLVSSIAVMSSDCRSIDNAAAEPFPR